MAAVQVLTDFTFTYEKGTTWGTAKATAPKGIPTEDMPITIEPKTHEIMRSYGYRGTNQDNMWMESTLSIPTASFSGPLVPLMMVDLLPGLLQKTPAWSGVANVYTMFTNNYSTLPDPTANEGYFFTLVRNSQVSGDDVILASAVVQSLTLKCDVTADNAVLVGDWSFIGKGYSKSQTSAGTISNIALTNLYKFSNLGVATFDSNDLLPDLVGFEFVITNGAKFVSDLPTGQIAFPKWEVTGKLKVLAGSTTEAMKNLVLSNDVSSAKLLKICFGDGTVSSAGELNLESYCYLTSWSSDYTEGESIEFGFKGVFTATQYPFQATFYYSA